MAGGSSRWIAAGLDLWTCTAENNVVLLPATMVRPEDTRRVRGDETQHEKSKTATAACVSGDCLSGQCWNARGGEVAE